MSTTPPPESPSRDQAILEILQLAAPIMEAYATTHQLHEWHCRVEDLIGTAYPTIGRTNDLRQARAALGVDDTTD